MLAWTNARVGIREQAAHAKPCHERADERKEQDAGLRRDETEGLSADLELAHHELTTRGVRKKVADIVRIEPEHVMRRADEDRSLGGVELRKRVVDVREVEPSGRGMR